MPSPAVEILSEGCTILSRKGSLCQHSFMPEKWKGLWQEGSKEFSEGKPKHLTVPPKSVNFEDLKSMVIFMGKIMGSFAE